MLRLLHLIFEVFACSFCARRDLLLENLALRQQLAVLARRSPQPRFSNGASPRPYRWRRVVKRDSARRCPGLRGWLPRAHHVLGDAGLADVDAQLKQFTVDAWCTPGGILSAHPADQVSNFTADARTSGLSVANLPSPKPAKPHTM